MFYFKSAVVTGSTSGIGLAIARALAKEGANVLINGFGEPHDIEKERAFEQAFRFLKNRIGTFINLPLASLDQLAMSNHLRQIGYMEGASSGAREDKPA